MLTSSISRLAHLTQRFSSLSLSASKLGAVVYSPRSLTFTAQQPTCYSTLPTKWPKVPDNVIYKYTPEYLKKTPEHHNNPTVEKMLKEELCNYPPFKSRRLFYGWQDWHMIRDYRRRCVAYHYAPLRTRLNVLRKNQILPKEIQVKASVQIHALPRDSCYNRIKKRCIFTSRRHSVKRRWRISRIVWRLLADYNKMSGAKWSFWKNSQFQTRKHLLWPPPEEDLTVADYLNRYDRNLADKDGVTTKIPGA